MKIALDIKSVIFYLWVALGLFTLGVFTIAHDYPGHFFSVIFNNAWAVTYITTINFILFEYTFPFALKKRKAVTYNILLGLTLLFVHLLFYSYGLYVWRLLGISLHVYTELVKYPSINKVLESQIAYSAGSFIIFGIARHIYNYIKLKQAAQQLSIEKQAAELNYLKSQTNPHFLFNTLNNIYSLARDKSDLTPESILRLSKILRFMLYETSGAYITIEQELKIIDNYIALEKLRFDESLNVNFNHDIEDMKQPIPPLLLVPLVENAFKHGASETRAMPFVDIKLAINQKQLTFVIKNSIEVFLGQQSVKESIGLSNLRRQLELLYITYNLSVQKNESVFTAILNINLASHV